MCVRVWEVRRRDMHPMLRMCGEGLEDAEWAGSERPSLQILICVHAGVELRVGHVQRSKMYVCNVAA